MYNNMFAFLLMLLYSFFFAEPVSFCENYSTRQFSQNVHWTVKNQNDPTVVVGSSGSYENYPSFFVHAVVCDPKDYARCKWPGTTATFEVRLTKEQLNPGRFALYWVHSPAYCIQYNRPDYCKRPISECEKVNPLTNLWETCEKYVPAMVVEDDLAHEGNNPVDIEPGNTGSVASSVENEQESRVLLF